MVSDENIFVAGYFPLVRVCLCMYSLIEYLRFSSGVEERKGKKGDPLFSRGPKRILKDRKGLVCRKTCNGEYPSFLLSYKRRL